MEIIIPVKLKMYKLKLKFFFPEHHKRYFQIQFDRLLNLAGCQMASMIHFVNKSELGPLHVQ